MTDHQKIVHKSNPLGILETKCPMDDDCNCDGEGYLKAVFCTFGVKDKDGDIVHAGAVGKQDVLLSAYGHSSWRGKKPIGKGKVYEKGNEAIFEGHFNMEIQDAKETFSALKFAPEMSEFSWGFNITRYDYSKDEDDTSWYGRILNIYETQIFEVSPVLLGAGYNTRVLDMKSARDEYPDQHAEQELAVPSPALVKARPSFARRNLTK